MIRLGAPSPLSREMDIDDIYNARVRLLIIMAKAFLGGCQLGEYRRKAILENARHVEAECIELGGLTTTYTELNRELVPKDFDHVFYQRVKLLAVMMKAVAKGFTMVDHRRQAMQENLDIICQVLDFKTHLEALALLKVA